MATKEKQYLSDLMVYLLIYQNFPLKITVKMPTEG